MSKYTHEYYLKHKEKILEDNRKWRKKNKKKWAEVVKKCVQKRKLKNKEGE